MRKNLLTLCLSAMVLVANAQQTTPNIVITFQESGKSVELAIGGQTGDEFKIDWGDGVLATYSKAAYYKGELKSKTIKVYGDKIMLLRARNLGIEALTVSNAGSLSQIQVGGNSIKQLDLKQAPYLTGLYAEDNKLELLDVTNNKFLRVIDVHSNKLAGEIDCSNMIKLSKVDISDNQYTKLTVPTHNTLQNVNFGNNLLTEIDVKDRKGLEELRCSGNRLTTLDLSGVTALTELYADGNHLTTLDLSGSTKLKTLKADNNLLPQVKTGYNTTLEGVYLYNNALETLDLSQNPNVRYLNVERNRLNTLPTVGHSLLSILIAGHNNIESVNLSDNNNLLQVKLNHNKLTTITVTNLKNMSWLKVDNNRLNELDLSKNKTLTWLECDSNRIDRLDLSHNTYLQWIAAEDNRLGELDLSANKKVQGLSLQNNEFALQAMNDLIGQLQDVSGVTINDYNRAWARILNITMPDADKADIATAKAKGWTVITGATTGIGKMITEQEEVYPIYYVTPAGIISRQPSKGINIVRYSNGTTRKVVF